MKTQSNGSSLTPDNKLSYVPYVPRRGSRVDCSNNGDVLERDGSSNTTCHYQQKARCYRGTSSARILRHGPVARKIHSSKSNKENETQIELTATKQDNRTAVGSWTNIQSKLSTMPVINSAR